MPKVPNRLVCENVSFFIGDGHPVTANLGYDRTGRLVEVAFCEAGKIGQGIQILLSDLGLKLSRALQRRNPDTGEPMVEAVR